MKRKQKRFNKDFEVQAEILKYKRKKKEHLVEAERLEAMAREEFRKSSVGTYGAAEQEFFRDNGRHLKRQAGKHRRSAFLIEEHMMPRLKEALSALQTKTMPFVGEDQSVVMGE